jgi:hypothetical protein
MSNPLAIAAVTETLVRLLFNGVNAAIPGTSVTARPLDKARSGITGNQINVFLYQTAPDAAWRNQDLPRQVRPGETAYPPLPLVLYYLVTAYGQNDDDSQAHRLLGYAMSTLHDHPLLSSAEIEAALPLSDLSTQPERVRITLQPLALEEISKLWAAFQTQYRISAAYQVSVVLIESSRPVRAALPVLRRGEQDRGPAVLALSAPVLTEARPPLPQPSLRLGEDLTLTGQNLDQAGLTVRFAHPRLEAPLEVPPSATGGTSRQISVHLPDQIEDPGALADWAPGFYTVALLVSRPDVPAWTSNSLAVALSPTISVSPLNAPAGDLTLTITCAPRLRAGQGARLLFGEQQLLPQTQTTPVDPSQPTTLTFLVPGATPGEYIIRLRVDGVDSLPFVRVGLPPQLEFAPNQKVTITP